METDKTFIRTDRKEFNDFYPLVSSFLKKNKMDVVIDGKKIRGYRTPDASSIWIRDYSDMMRGIKYFEPDLKSAVEHFAETQGANGRIFDYFTTSPEKLPCERENWTKYVRVPVEADVEYRFIKAVFLAWQATGDDVWMKHMLPSMEKALEYIWHHPWRRHKNTSLVKRAYTIDTWDFAYTAGKHDWLQFQINDDTFWGIMHGDNSGYYEAFRIMSFFYDYLKEKEQAEGWKARAQNTRADMNRICWNGKFYSHFAKITPVDIPGVDESVQLSLSNPMDINRGVPTHKMAVSIIREYQRRRETTDSFAEWFSIDPPFPDGIFGDKKLKQGAYVNGGIMPLVGGELARAAFEHGYEKYGVDILQRYYRLAAERGETFLWYFPDGTAPTRETSTSPEASPADAWGSTAMLYALIEGLAGIEDRSKLFQKTRISPRWPAAGISEAEVRVEYANSQTFTGYSIRYEAGKIEMEAYSSGTETLFHILLPEQTEVNSVSIEGSTVDWKKMLVEQSCYLDFNASVSGSAKIIIT